MFRFIARIHFSILLAAILLLACAPPILAQNDADPTTAVKTVIDQATAILKNKQVDETERQRQLRELVEGHFDFEGMARSALGYHWRDLTPDQRREFVPLFTSFIEDAYLSRMKEYTVEKIQQDLKSSNVQFTKQVIDGTDATVYSTVKLQDRPNPVEADYKMSKDTGQWKIYDINIDAISVIANYRNQFNRVINNEGYDKLVSILKQKQQALSKSLNQ
ncbi:MAG TPA: ABC transporter substrate-binding protein [Candidatus Binataceae bacterium]